jgi:hypothetical protein
VKVLLEIDTHFCSSDNYLIPAGDPKIEDFGTRDSVRKQSMNNEKN